MTACKVKIISDNDPQVVIYMPVIMPFHKPDHTYTANSTLRGYRTAESLHNTYVYYAVYIIGGPETIGEFERNIWYHVSLQLL